MILTLSIFFLEESEGTLGAGGGGAVAVGSGP